MIGRLKVLLRGDADRVAESVSRADFESVAQFSLIILIGAGVYGATLGLWRGPLQAFYTAIKFPLVIFLTCLGNGAINAPLYVYVTRWFEQRRGAALALLSGGPYLAGATLPPLFERAISSYGWRPTMLAYGILVATVVVPLALIFLKPAPEAPVSPKPGKRLKKDERQASLF